MEAGPHMRRFYCGPRRSAPQYLHAAGCCDLPAPWPVLSISPLAATLASASSSAEDSTASTASPAARGRARLRAASTDAGPEPFVGAQAHGLSWASGPA